MVRGIDCATKLTATSVAGIKAVGYAFAGRYLVPNEGSLAWKALTKNEAQIITNAGLRLLTVWEATADRVKGGASAGKEDGARAYQCALNIGMPTNGIIYFAVDYDALTSECSTIADYLRAAREQTGEYEIGVYGSYYVVEAIASRKVCKAYWQCLAWSAGKRSQYLNVYQGEFNKTVAGVGVDINECPDMDAAGIWTYSATQEGGTTNMPTYTSPMIGHASIDENGRANGGKAGDQTGKEVCVRTFYNGNWNIVLRPKSMTVGEIMATACEILCNGNLVGYDQYERNSLWDELERVGWDAKKLAVKCETDCSAFITALAKVAGIEVARVPFGNGKYNAPVTSTMRKAFLDTGAFELLTGSKYTASADYLRRGDILVRESGHTALVLTNGKLSGATQPSTDTQDDIIVNYQCTVIASSLNCRTEPNASATIITSYVNGTILTITKERNGWGYNGIGWVSLDWVQKNQNTVEGDDYMTREQILKEIGDQYIRTYSELPDWAKPVIRELLDDGTINGGTDASVDPNDINMFLSDIKTILVLDRMIKKLR